MSTDDSGDENISARFLPGWRHHGHATRRQAIVVPHIRRASSTKDIRVHGLVRMVHQTWYTSLIRYILLNKPISIPGKMYSVVQCSRTYLWPTLQFFVSIVGCPSANKALARSRIMTFDTHWRKNRRNDMPRSYGIFKSKLLLSIETRTSLIEGPWCLTTDVHRNHDGGDEAKMIYLTIWSPTLLQYIWRLKIIPFVFQWLQRLPKITCTAWDWRQDFILKLSFLLWLGSSGLCISTVLYCIIIHVLYWWCCIGLARQSRRYSSKPYNMRRTWELYIFMQWIRKMHDLLIWKGPLSGYRVIAALQNIRYCPYFI